ncbi:MAG: hypothetical protein ABI893_08895 [Polaromonas sp.]|uniref:hypothetical protein n=1 Tax=Polaromonas sp. TaxID=1869339 RepID=UPI0032645715
MNVSWHVVHDLRQAAGGPAHAFIVQRRSDTSTAFCIRARQMPWQSGHAKIFKEKWPQTLIDKRKQLFI